MVRLLLSAGLASAQEAHEHEGETEHKNEIGIFAGALVNVAAEETGPSIGADYTREVTPSQTQSDIHERRRLMQLRRVPLRRRFVRGAYGLALASMSLLLLPPTQAWSQDEETRETFQAFAVSMGTVAPGASTTLQITITWGRRAHFAFQ